MEFNFDFDEDDPLVQAQVKQRKTFPQKTVIDYIPKHDYAEVSRMSTTNNYDLPSDSFLLFYVYSGFMIRIHPSFYKQNTAQTI